MLTESVEILCQLIKSKFVLEKYHPTVANPYPLIQNTYYDHQNYDKAYKRV